MTRPSARLVGTLIAGLASVGLAFALACTFGPQRVSIPAALAGAEPDRTILLALRVPRALAAAIVGAALAGAGVALQALLRNVLADPFVLGVSGGGALGGGLVILGSTAAARALGPHAAAIASALPVSAGAMAGALGATLLVLALGRLGGRLVPQSVLLVGVVFNAFAVGVITLLRLLVPPEQANRLAYWLTGSIGYERPRNLAVGGLLVLAAVATLIALSARLNLLTVGDDDAAALGVDVRRVRGWIFVAASTATGAAVALAGMVGFVGLIVPHLVRRVVGPDHRLLVPASALFGAAFLVLADAAARLAFLSLGTEPPVGALTALLGGPFFLSLLRKTTRPDEEVRS